MGALQETITSAHAGFVPWYSVGQAKKANKGIKYKCAKLVVTVPTGTTPGYSAFDKAFRGIASCAAQQGA